MKKFFVFTVALFFISFAKAEELATPDLCIALLLEDGFVVTEDVTFTGNVIDIDGGSTISPYDTITIWFHEDPLVWHPATFETNSLADWILTSLATEEREGFRTFAAQDEEGSIFLVNQLSFNWAGIPCFLHRIYYGPSS